MAGLEKGLSLRPVVLIALALMIATIPLENVWVLGSGSVTRLLGVLVFMLGFVALFQGGRLRFRPPPMFLVVAALFVLWGVLSYYWSLQPATSFSRGVTFLQLLALAWVVWEYGRDERSRMLLMAAYLIGAYITIGVAFTNFLRPGSGYRELGEGLNANYFSMALALGIPMAWRLTFLTRHRLIYWFATPYLPLAVAGVVIAASRGGFVATLIALMIVPLTFSRLTLARKLVLIALIGVGVWAIFFYAPQVFPQLQQNTERIFETSDELREGTLTGRRDIWAAGWQVFADHPYLGVGWGSYAAAIAPIYGRAITAHNAYLATLVEVGPLGLLLFVAMFGTIVFPLASSLRGPKFWFVSIILMTLAVSMYSATLENAKGTWFVLALLAAELPWIATFQESARPLRTGQRKLGI